jgi:SAM-dependent methyltransferase
VLRFLGSIPRRLRWTLQRWSPAADRAFHDTLFSAHRYDPFTFAYPGYVTIRRFADLAAEHLNEVRHAIDLGCGPGEITCELARRYPDVAFTGVDHSAAAVARAGEHARALGLSNVRFEAADISTFVPQPAADIVLMFDSFHHLLDPGPFVRTWGRSTPRFFLIEPAGDWLGGWQRTLDLDWIVPAIDTIRSRIAWQLGEDKQSGAAATAGLKAGATPAAEAGPNAKTQATAGLNAGAAPAAGLNAGEAVEHRYTLGDFKQFFDGFGLQVQGTIAGVETYPPDPYGRPALRDEFGKAAYDAIVAIEEVLIRQNLDLHAKHWAIHAERGAPHALRTPRPIHPRESGSGLRVEGPYDVEYMSYDGGRAAAPGTTLLATVRFRNKSWRSWDSRDPAAPVFLSYHWLDADGTLAIDDGLRTPLPHAVAPGAACEMTCRIDTPPRAGRYTLTVDLVEEGVTWFSRAGAPLLKVDFRVR